MNFLHSPVVGEPFERDQHSLRVIEYPVVDEFETSPSQRARINGAVEELTALGYLGNTSIADAIARKRTNSSVNYNNPATVKLIEDIAGVKNWLDLVPTARALTNLYSPNATELPNGHIVGDELRIWFTELADGRGLRFRGQMVTDIIAKEGLRVIGKVEEFRVASLASGVAQQVIDASRIINENTSQFPNLTLVDADSTALADATRNALQIMPSQNFRTERMNVLQRQGLVVPLSLGAKAVAGITEQIGGQSFSKERLEKNSYDVVEVVGLLEYLQEEDWGYSYGDVIKLRQKHAGAVTLLKNAYELVAPGGLLLVGNMLDTHPQLGFTLNTIQWPHIQPRSILQMQDIFSEAGMNNSQITVYVPDDEAARVYALYGIRKPEIGQG